MENVKENKMGSYPVLKLIITMSLPAMFSMLIQALYNVVDSIFVAKIGEEALTAISIVYPAQMLLISVGVGTGIGINSLVSRRLGEGKKDEASLAAGNGLTLGVLSWVVFAVIGAFFSRTYMEFFSDNAKIVDMGTQYLSVVSIFSFGVFVELNAEKTLQATGNMIYPMLFQLTGAVTNIILDPIFIFGLLGVPAMGIKGAAIATVIGQIFAMIFALIILFVKDHDVHISLKNAMPHWQTVKNIYAVGIPSIVMQAIASLLVTALNKILIEFSETAVAVLGVYYKLQSFVFMPVFGLTHGVMPIMGYNFGAKNKERLMKALRYGLIIAFCIMLAGMIIFWVFPKQLLGMFNPTENMISIGVWALRSISLCFTPAALGIMVSTLFQAIGHGTKSLIVSILRQLVLILPSAYIFSKIGGLNYVWFAFPLAEIGSFAVSMLLFASVYKKIINPLGEMETAEL